MSRIDVVRGGITGARKTAIVCEAYGLRCEMHMAGWGNLQVIGATPEDTSEYYEKGLLAPGVDYDAPHPYLKNTCDKIDAEGYVHLPKGPGMGYEIEWDYINDNLMDPTASTRSSGSAAERETRMSSIKRSVQAMDLLARKGPLGVRAVAQQLRCRSARSIACCSTSRRNRSSSARPTASGSFRSGSSRSPASSSTACSSPRLAHPFAERIAEATHETVNINALHGMAGVCIDKVRGNEGMQLDMRIGSRGPLHLGGAGKAMLAFMTEADQRADPRRSARGLHAEIPSPTRSLARRTRPHPPARLFDRRPGGRDGRLLRRGADPRSQWHARRRPQHHRSVAQEGRAARSCLWSTCCTTPAAPSAAASAITAPGR